MIIVPILDGYSASSRPFHSRLHSVVLEALGSTDAIVLAKRALFSKHRAKLR